MGLKPILGASMWQCCAVLCWGGIRCAAGLGKQSWGLGVLLGEGLGG